MPLLVHMIFHHYKVFWHCRDLELFNQLGILNGEVLKQKYDQRVMDKQALLNSLHS